ncbi:MAG TPA: SPW repeat protein [Chloroflexota bacterium]|nr:SPW repeat protein [Chloroflexota bacterium]
MVAPSGVRQVKLASGLSVLAGLWEIAAPFALGYANLLAPTTDAVVVGALVLVLAAIRSIGADRETWLSWVVAALGLWLVLAPFVLGYDVLTSPTSNDVGIGIVIFTLGTWAALASSWLPPR